MEGKKGNFKQYILVFIAIVITLSVIFYFMFKIPELKKQVAEVNKEREFQEYYRDHMIKTQQQLDSIYKDGVNVEYMRMLFNTNLVDMQKRLPRKDSSYVHEMYDIMISNFLEIHDLREERIELLSQIQQQKEELIDSYRTVRSLLPQDVKRKNHYHKPK
ncbi:type VI secretion system TssO [Aquimarina algiphila]|uniref:type VI secretion system TssO n=1 Tax=Aquimarina algiphila TaxID=2047982 RepID=UPI002330154E|nr:type VI secretion system TssO [Aquimarina algiphila]